MHKKSDLAHLGFQINSSFFKPAFNPLQGLFSSVTTAIHSQAMTGMVKLPQQAVDQYAQLASIGRALFHPLEAIGNSHASIRASSLVAQIGLQFDKNPIADKTMFGPLSAVNNLFISYERAANPFQASIPFAKSLTTQIERIIQQFSQNSFAFPEVTPRLVGILSIQASQGFADRSVFAGVADAVLLVDAAMNEASDDNAESAAPTSELLSPLPSTLDSHTPLGLILELTRGIDAVREYPADEFTRAALALIEHLTSLFHKAISATTIWLKKVELSKWLPIVISCAALYVSTVQTERMGEQNDIARAATRASPSPSTPAPIVLEMQQETLLRQTRIQEHIVEIQRELRIASSPPMLNGATEVDQQSFKPRRVITRETWMKISPDDQSARIARLSAGTILEDLEVKGKWVQVQHYDSGKDRLIQGWIKKKLSQKMKPTRVFRQRGL